MFKSKNLIRGGEIKPTDLFVLHIDSHGTFHGTGFEIFNPLIFLIGLSIRVNKRLDSIVNDSVFTRNLTLTTPNASQFSHHQRKVKI
ncbi:unnamed protein product [Rotaria sordida]|uniref:Uncharacterized protein n=1 Tax=Rotaria sordida TaxID=392033 RepID=A0A815LTY4_9BILA|nr:unnamed protein product [Rotaria sordida]CAF4022783.1 unnamed protein product [Rotaria sordida]CAF4096494.1 unnamed protein product [Rotaria sordida]